MLRIVSLWRHDPSHTIVSTRVVPIEEIRAKEGNLSIPLYVGGETQAQTDAATETATSALPNALAGWLESSTAVRQSLQSLLTAEKWALF